MTIYNRTSLCYKHSKTFYKNKFVIIIIPYTNINQFHYINQNTICCIQYKMKRKKLSRIKTKKKNL